MTTPAVDDCVRGTRGTLYSAAAATRAAIAAAAATREERMMSGCDVDKSGIYAVVSAEPSLSAHNIRGC